MTTKTTANFVKCKSLLLDNTASSRLTLEPAFDLHPMDRSDRQDVQLRKQQVAEAWSKEERAARLRAGTARRAWLMRSIAVLETK